MAMLKSGRKNNFHRISQFSTMLSLIFFQSDIHSPVSTVLRVIKVITTVNIVYQTWA